MQETAEQTMQYKTTTVTKKEPNEPRYVKQNLLYGQAEMQDSVGMSKFHHRRWPVRCTRNGSPTSLAESHLDAGPDEPVADAASDDGSFDLAARPATAREKRNKK